MSELTQHNSFLVIATTSSVEIFTQEEIGRIKASMRLPWGCSLPPSLQSAIWLLVFCLLDCDTVDAQAARKRPQKAAPRGGSRRAGRGQSNANDGLYLIAILFVMCLLPPLFTLVRSIVTDPMTPTIMKDAAAAIKERTTGYLSARKKQLQQDDRKKA